MICKTFPLGTCQAYKYVVVFSCYQGNLLLSRHKARSTWETQGGHIEPGETPLDAARRELYEESGAVEYDIHPLFDYWAAEDDSDPGAYGQVFLADIQCLTAIPDSEMAETGLFDILPHELTYPGITPVLFARLREQEDSQ